MGNPVQEKSYAFALRVIKLSRYLRGTRREFVLSKQVLRSGISIGANIEEALGGQSERDFLAKMSIALKEARETHYWLRLLRDGAYLTPAEAGSILEDCDELLRLLTSIVKTTKAKQQ